MGKIKFKIDEKSLFYGVKNDYQKGQSATVHTPINQSKNPEKWHQDILQLTKLKIGISGDHVSDDVKKACLPKTTSHANSKLNEIYVFSNISFDGKPLDIDYSFAMYIKEETDKYIVGRDGKVKENTHLGRLKLHYPTALHFSVSNFNVDNKRVLDSILGNNGGFAFVVNGFEYDTDTHNLNFLTSLIGPIGIPLSNVFKRQKGTGKKLLLSEVNEDVLNFVQDYVVGIQPSNEDVELLLSETEQTRIANGKLGEDIIFEKIKTLHGVSDIHHISKDYPFSPYDIEYVQDGIKKYAEVKATQGTRKVFNMSRGEINFMNTYAPYYTLFLVLDVKSPSRSIIEYKADDINNMNFEHPSTRFYAED